MTRYSQVWVSDLLAAAETAEADATEPLRLLYVVTDTADGKVAFHLDFADGKCVTGTAGKLPRGEKATVTVTAKEAVLLELWTGGRSRDAAFMAGDLKIEGAYERWLDELTPRFTTAPWLEAFAGAAG